MAGKPLYDWPADDDLVDLVIAHGRPGAARELGVSLSGLQHHITKRGMADRCNEGRLVDPQQSRRVDSTDPKEWGDVRGLVKRAGLTPEDWVIRSARVNQWGGPDGQENKQLRVDLGPAVNLLGPARTDGWKAPKVPKLDRAKSFMFAAFGDRHCPDHDERLHAASLAWLQEFQPELFIDLGDLLDFAELSRHRKNPSRPQPPQTCIQAGYDVKRAEIQASPKTRHVMIPGNHDWRLRNHRIDHQPEAYGLRRADNPDGDPDRWPVESLPYLLRFDELNVEFVGGDDDYDQYEYEIAPGIVGLHGYKARPKAASTVGAMIDDYAMSVVVGHVHRQGITTLTKPDTRDGTPREYLGMEVGGAYRRGDTLGYDHRGGNHQHGFGVGTVWPDGRHAFELARWDGRSLVWRNWRCTP